MQFPLVFESDFGFEFDSVRFDCDSMSTSTYMYISIPTAMLIVGVHGDINNEFDFEADYNAV